MLSQGLLDIENLASFWAASGEGEPIPRKELLELRAILYPYFRAFLGDSNCLKRSKSLEVPSHSIQTLFLTPRIFGQQQSTLPLPPHWLYLPLFDEDDDEATGVGMNDFSSLSAMVAVQPLCGNWKCARSPAHMDRRLKSHWNFKSLLFYKLLSAKKISFLTLRAGML